MDKDNTYKPLNTKYMSKIKPQSESLATDYLLAALALLEEADSVSKFKTNIIQAMIEQTLQERANLLTNGGTNVSTT